MTWTQTKHTTIIWCPSLIDCYKNKGQEGNWPLLQILQTYTLPLCYLAFIFNEKLDLVGFEPHLMCAKHLLYLVGATSPLHPVRFELTFLPWKSSVLTSWTMGAFLINGEGGSRPSTTTYETDKLPYSTSPLLILLLFRSNIYIKFLFQNKFLSKIFWYLT